MMSTLVTVTLLAPALAALAVWVTRRWAAPLALAGGAVAFLGALSFFFALSKGESVSLPVFNLASLNLHLVADAGDALLLLVVTSVSFFVFVYALRYMREKGRAVWFWAAMCLFLAGMELLVLAGDWLLFLVGWETMAVASFLLIGTHHEEEESQRGAVKAYLLTRATDMGLYIGVFSIFAVHGSLQIQGATPATLPVWGALGLLIGAMGKSAQVPFQSWLAGAMQGPTPVSALLHSATMVAAGALLLVKAFPLFSPDMLAAIALVGGITAVMAGLTAIVSSDIKLMLAASTSSQLGLMFLALGAGFPGAALAHWVAHAYMKSTLFLSAGLFQERFGSTEFASLRGGGKRSSAAYWTLAIVGLALAGLPPLIGYFSKDAVLAAALKGPLPVVYFTLAALAALATGVYIARALSLLWRGKPPREEQSHFTLMQLGMLVLAAVVVGTGFWLHSGVSLLDFEMPKSTWAKAAGLVALAIGAPLGWWMGRFSLDRGLFRYARDNYAFAGGYQRLVARPVLQLAQVADRFDNALANCVILAGRGGARISHSADSSDERLHRAFFHIGHSGLRISRAGHQVDRFFDWMIGGIGRVWRFVADASAVVTETDIIRGIDEIAEFCRRLGSRGRQLQSGMTHQELLVTVTGATAGLVIIIVTLLFV